MQPQNLGKNKPSPGKKWFLGSLEHLSIDPNSKKTRIFTDLILVPFGARMALSLSLENRTLNFFLKTLKTLKKLTLKNLLKKPRKSWFRIFLKKIMPGSPHHHHRPPTHNSGPGPGRDGKRPTPSPRRVNCSTLISQFSMDQSLRRFRSHGHRVGHLQKFKTGGRGCGGHLEAGCAVAWRTASSADCNASSALCTGKLQLLFDDISNYKSYWTCHTDWNIK